MENFCNINSPQYSKDWRETLFDDRSMRAFSRETPRYAAIPEPVVDLVSKLCAELELSPEIEFTCLDSFDYFFVNHFNELKEKIEEHLQSESEKEPLTESEMWTNMGNLVQRQTFLRILSVLSVCAKFVDSRKDIGINNIQTLLGAAKCSYDSEAIKNSEYRIFRNMGFTIQKPVAYDSIMYFVGKCEEKLNLDESLMIEISMKLLRILYLDRDKIYSSLVTGNSTEAALTAMKNDQVLAGIGVVFASTYFMKLPPEVTQEVLSLLSDEGNYDEFDISQLGQTMCKFILDEDTTETAPIVTSASEQECSIEEL